MVDGFLGGEEPVFDAVVDVTSLEADPIALPALGLVGMVAVPLAGEEQEQVALLDACLFLVLALEHSLAFGNVKQLVLVEDSPLVNIEVVTIGMSLGGVGITWQYLLIPHSTDVEPP